MQGLPPSNMPAQMPTPGQAPPLPESFSQNPAGVEVGLWPLAWGWWVLIIFGICALMGLLWWWRHYRQKRVYLRMAVKEVQTQDITHHNLKSNCNQILKRTFMSYFPVEAVASLHGEKWTEFLRNQLSGKQQMVMLPFLSRLSEGFYQKNSDATGESSESNQNSLPDMSDQEFVVSTIKLLKQALPPSKKQLQLLEQSHD